MSWVHLTTAPDQIVAEMWTGLLRNEGVSALIRPGDTASFLGVSAYPCRIIVRDHQLDHAREVLESQLERDAGGEE